MATHRFLWTVETFRPGLIGKSNIGKDAGTSFLLLRNGVRMPVLGLGCAGLGSKSEEVFKAAVGFGYRMFDTAAQVAVWYQNEDIVGKVTSTLKRSEIFLVTKIHPQDLGTNATAIAITKSLQNLRTTYIDVLIMHYPQCDEVTACTHPSEGDYFDAWRVMEKAYEQGLVRAIGVSNFRIDQLQQLLRTVRVKPHVLQLWLDPLHQARDVVALCRKNEIAVESYSTLGTQWMNAHAAHGNPVLEHRVIATIALKVNRTPTDVVLRWAIQSNFAVIPRSANQAHLRSNFVSPFEFSLTAEEMAQINELDGGV